MKYLLRYKIFEEQNNVDLSDELNKLEKGLEVKGKGVQNLVLQLAESDPEMKKKLDTRKENMEEDKEKDVNESVIVALALSSGAVLQIVGKIFKFMGKKLSKDDQSRIFKVGESIEKYGHKVHHKIIGLINTILKPLIFWMSDKKQKEVSNAVFMVILAVKITSGSFDPSDYKTAAHMTEGLLNSVKATEIINFIKTYGKILLQLVKII